ncbi:hypothetical protein [Acaryochloris sp. IP29b_bin.137]|uniref:hypothetical protein n=1 Tax=Acaryochloris sp. IP29b_bin.137 TaxID=2969217 RepID=UPI002635F10B|nr:hypothetical protein [Acaryochloris sp. IP29b_bin.137]
MGHWHLRLAINPLQTALDRWLQSLADSYPALSWMVAHPVWAIISLLVVLAIVQILLGWISSGIRHLLFSIVKSPYSLVKWLLGQTTAPLSPPKRNKLSFHKPSERVSTLLRRLDHLHQEQETLILELKTILSHKDAELHAPEASSPSSISESETPTSKISSS